MNLTKFERQGQSHNSKMKIIIKYNGKELCSFRVIDGRILDKENCNLVSIIADDNEDIKIIEIGGANE